MGETNMSVQDYFEELVRIEKVVISTPFGEEITYKEGETISGAIGTLSKKEMLIAEANENKSIYVITTSKDVLIEYGAIIKRSKNGRALRITSDWRDAEPPKISSFNWVQVNAEEFDIPE